MLNKSITYTAITQRFYRGNSWGELAKMAFVCLFNLRSDYNWVEYIADIYYGRELPNFLNDGIITESIKIADTMIQKREKTYIHFFFRKRKRV